jgi:hypothetical protein
MEAYGSLKGNPCCCLSRWINVSYTFGPYLDLFFSIELLESIDFMTNISFTQTVEETPDDILKLRHDIDAELFGEDQSWGRVENNVSVFSVFYLFCKICKA